MRRETARVPACPLHNQTGPAAVLNYEAILASFAPALRQAFEDERAARQAELEDYYAAVAARRSPAAAER